MLRDALLTLAGPAWELSVDDLSRRSASAGTVLPPSFPPTRPAPPAVPDADRPEEMQP